MGPCLGHRLFPGQPGRSSRSWPAGTEGAVGDRHVAAQSCSLTGLLRARRAGVLGFQGSVVEEAPRPHRGIRARPEIGALSGKQL